MTLSTPPFDSRALRDALGCYPTDVTVVTTMEAGGQARGFTANSFTSVSLDPPLLLVCLAKNAHSHDTFVQSKTFAIHILGEQQRATSSLFASKAPDKFAQIAWHTSPHQVPLLADCLATFECATHALVDAGDHTVLIGRVLAFTSQAGRPLGYCRGAYVGYQDASTLDSIAKDSARVSALVETPQGVAMHKAKDGHWTLPTSNRLGTPPGAGSAATRSGLYPALESLGLDATLDFVFSVYEDALGPCVVYRGRAPAAPATPELQYLPLQALDQFGPIAPVTATMLQRYASERSEDMLGIYVGDALSGTILPLQTPAAMAPAQPSHTHATPTTPHTAGTSETL
jgi:flavin reductase (DIM6/NTAB) family NADH-FMN oxidoreductase RutF